MSALPDKTVRPLFPLERALTDIAVSPFWRRALAFAIDTLLLAVLCSGLAFFATPFFERLGPWGRAFGGILGAIYFGIGASAVASGQTPGKRFAKIAVRRVGGGLLSLPAALVRAAIVMLPLTINGFALGTSSFPVVLFSTIVVVALGGSLTYLVAFNRPARRCVHDYATHSIVVHVPAPPELPTGSRHPRVHVTVVSLLLVLSVVLPIAGRRFGGDWTALLRAREDIIAIAHTPNVQVMNGATWMNGRSSTWIHASAVTYVAPPNAEDMASDIAAVILRDIPDADTRQQLVVSIVTGYDVGFASGWKSTNWNETPAEWRRRLASRGGSRSGASAERSRNPVVQP